MLPKPTSYITEANLSGPQPSEAKSLPLRYASETSTSYITEANPSGPQPSEANADHFDTLPKPTKYGSVSKWS